jgi:DNA-directed RNA polymerase specialized sigma24 family protein
MSDAAQRPIGTIQRRLHTARNRLRDQLFETQPA